MKRMNTAILLSGGVGSRLQSQIPKQYLNVSGKMVITYSLETLIKSPDIDEIRIVAEGEWRDSIINEVKELGISTEKIKDFVTPGSTRQESIWNGLQNIFTHKDGVEDTGFTKKIEDRINRAKEKDSFKNIDYVMIHDAARPLLTEKMIHECFTAIKNHDGVMPVLPMKDTVYYSKDGVCVSELLERKSLFAGQAPEVFDFNKYYQANLALLPERIYKIGRASCRERV